MFSTDRSAHPTRKHWPIRERNSFLLPGPSPKQEGLRQVTPTRSPLQRASRAKALAGIRSLSQVSKDVRPDRSPGEAESSFVIKNGLGFWLKPLFEKRAEAGSGPHVSRLSDPKGPAYYASRQPAEAGS